VFGPTQKGIGGGDGALYVERVDRESGWTKPSQWRLPLSGGSLCPSQAPCVCDPGVSATVSEGASAVRLTPRALLHPKRPVTR